MEKYENKEWLENELKAKSVKELCEEFGFSQTTIYRKIKKYNITINKDVAYRNKEWLKLQLDNGVKVMDIAAQCECDEHTISRWIKKFNLDKKEVLYRNKDWLEKEVLKYNTVAEMAQDLNINPSTLSDWLNRFGIYKKNYSLRKLNENYFEKIDTEHKAYWLGFLMADGYMHKSLKNFGMTLKSEDRYILDLFKSDIEFDGEITDGLGGFNTPCSTLVVCSSKMCKDLVYHGIVPKKTGKESIPNDLSKELVFHFIRGFFDGDGTLGKENNNHFALYSCSYNILFSINEYFKKEFNISATISRINRNPDVNFFCYNLYNIKAMNVLDSLYKNSTIRLDRKFEKYKSMIKK